MFLLTDDQRLFEATTAQFLATHFPADYIRGLRERAIEYGFSDW